MSVWWTGRAVEGASPYGRLTGGSGRSGTPVSTMGDGKGGVNRSYGCWTLVGHSERSETNVKNLVVVYRIKTGWSVGDGRFFANALNDINRAVWWVMETGRF